MVRRNANASGTPDQDAPEIAGISRSSRAVKRPQYTKCASATGGLAWTVRARCAPDAGNRDKQVADGAGGKDRCQWDRQQVAGMNYDHGSPSEQPAQRREGDRHEERRYQEVADVELPGPGRRLARIVRPLDQPPAKNPLGNPEGRSRDCRHGKQAAAQGDVHAAHRKDNGAFPQHQDIAHGHGQQEGRGEPHDEVSRPEHRPERDQTGLGDQCAAQQRPPMDRSDRYRTL